MKKTTKRAMLASGIVGVATVGVLASGGFAYANTGQQSLADNIATKFKLNKTEVQKVIDQDREQHEADHLAKLVKDGKLTQAQADKLKVEEDAIHAKMEAARNETDPAKRKAARDAIKAEMDQWAKNNGIDLSTIRPGRGMHGPGDMGMGRMMHDGDTDDTPPAQ